MDIQTNLGDTIKWFNLKFFYGGSQMNDDQMKTLSKIDGAAALLLYAVSGISLLQVGALAGGVYLADKVYSELKGNDKHD